MAAARPSEGHARFLTNTVVAKLPVPASGKAVYPEKNPKHRGLRIVVTDRGSRVWWLTVWWTARRRTFHMRLGDFPEVGDAEARARAKAARKVLDNGGDPRHAPDDDAYLFENVVAAFLAKAERTTKSWRETKRIIERELLPPWRGRDVRKITRLDCVTLTDPIVKRSPTMANRVAGVMSRLFQFMLDRATITAHPSWRFRPGGKESKRSYDLTDDEIRAFWANAEAKGYPFGTIDKLLMLTAMRRNEVAGLRWRELDLSPKRARWMLPASRSKNDLPHIIPLAPMALKVLSKVPKADGRELLFTVTGNTPVSGFSKVARRRKKALGSDARLHDVRRTVRTRLSEIGVKPYISERVLCHTKKGEEGTYDQYEFEKEKREALLKWERRLRSILAAKARRKD